MLLREALSAASYSAGRRWHKLILIRVASLESTKYGVNSILEIIDLRSIAETRVPKYGVRTLTPVAVFVGIV